LSIAEVAAIVSTTLEQAGITAVLSGGSVVSIYIDFKEVKAWSKRQGHLPKYQEFFDSLAT
jgi:hypothetical protein